MAAITSAVVGTAVAVKGMSDSKKAQKKAAKGQRDAAIESATLLAKAGKAGEADIMRQNAEARYTSNLAAVEAAEQLQPFANTEAFNQTVNDFMGNLPVDGAIASSIRDASLGFAMNSPEFKGMIGNNPVGREIERQGDLSVSAATPQFNDAKMQNAQAGLAGAIDVAQIEQSGLNRLGDIAGSEASQRANALIGQSSQLANLSNTADDAKLLSGVASQNFNTGATEQLAGLAGNLTQQYKGRARDEFGFDGMQDPFNPNNFK